MFFVESEQGLRECKNRMLVDGFMTEESPLGCKCSYFGLRIIYCIDCYGFAIRSVISDAVVLGWFRKMQFSRDHIETIADGISAISNEENR
jgi:hypothetical protein